ncbi:MAG TPA: hypothetical protein VG672_09185 [Bryobacteraceae bacterium]|jgi:hypothetical protein|nr:hypothetical protein [Bryobacteraceae bacterium]
MFRQFFQSAVLDDEKPMNGTGRNSSAERNSSAPEPALPAETRVSAAPTSAPIKAGPGPELGKATFSEIYRGSTVKLPDTGYNILKVADMISSAHLSTMSPDAKRCALLMALEAAAVEVEVLLQDAMLRQRALNDYEEEQRKRLKEFEAGKATENSHIQAELDRVTADYMRRIQANMDEVARRQDEFDAWLRRKQQESQRIVEAAALCVHPGAASNGDLTAVLERAAVPAGSPRR